LRNLPGKAYQGWQIFLASPLTALAMRISDILTIDESAIEERFVRSGGPGGQNVNKVATKCELRLDLARARLPEAVLARLKRLAGRRISLEGILILDSERFRSQDMNRADARAKLAALVQKAAIAPKARIATKPSYGSKQRRLTAKSVRGGVIEEEDVS